MLSGACGLAAAGRLGRRGRSFAATFVFGESAPLEGAVVPGAGRRADQRGLPPVARELGVRIYCPARAWDPADEPPSRGVQ